MASPHVAGVAALYKQANPSASTTTIRNAIVNNATTNVISNVGTGYRIGCFIRCSSETLGCYAVSECFAVTDPSAQTKALDTATLRNLVHANTQLIRTFVK